MAHGIAEACQRRVKAVPLIVHRQVDVPIGEDGVFVGCRKVNLVLPELVVDIHQRGVGVEVVQIVTRILGVEHHLVAVAELALVGSLQEEVAIPLLLGMLPHIIDDGTGDALTAVVEIGLGVPFATGHHAEDSALDTIGTHVTVLPYCSGVPRQGAVAVVLAVTETILTRSVGELAVERQAHRATQFMLPTHTGIHEPEGARLERHIHVVTLAILELGTAGAQVDSACRAIVLGALENVTTLTVVK